MAIFPPLSNFVLLSLALVQSINVTQNHPSPPTPALALPPLPEKPPPCDVLLFKLMDCLSYLLKGSQMAKPHESCCSGFLEAWKLDSKCLCEAINGSVIHGFHLNMARAVHFSSACGFQHVSLDECLPKPLEETPPPLEETPLPSPAIPPTPAMATSDVDSSSLYLMLVLSLVVLCLLAHDSRRK